MIGIALLLIALVCYLNRNIRWLSYVLYIGFLSNGYIVLTDSVIGFKNQDLAIIYTFFIGLYLFVNGQFKFPRIPVFRWLKIFLVFIIFSALFSLFYYGFTPFQVLQGGRSWLLIFCVPILIRMSHGDFEIVIKTILYITLITSLLYIVQIVFSRPILPYDSEGEIDYSTGLIRLYNYPPFLMFCFLLSYLNTKIFKMIWVWRTIFSIAVVCTLGRTYILTAILTLFIVNWIQGGGKRIIKIGTILIMLLIFFGSVVANRFEGANTNSDLRNISQGGFTDYTSGQGQTMTFRLALLYERVNYLVHRPLPEQIFGMGLISESQPKMHQMYDFHIGLVNEETGLISQLHSPDIAWANTICGLGFVGTIIYLCFLVNLTIFFYRKRQMSLFFTIAAGMSLCSYIASFAGSTFSECRTLAIYFIVMSTGLVSDEREIETYKT